MFVESNGREELVKCRGKKILCSAVPGQAPRAATHPKPQREVAGWRKELFHH